MQRLLDFNFVFNFTENKEEVAFTYKVTNPNTYPRLILNSEGTLQHFTWLPETQEWDLAWMLYLIDCELYRVCGHYSYCDVNTRPNCNCIKGFGPRDLQAWLLEGGIGQCLRKTQLSCSGDKFIHLKNMKLPDTRGVIVDKRIGLKECEERCNRNCNCTGYANTDIQNGGSCCVMWTRPIFVIRNYPAAGQDLYVKVAAGDLGVEEYGGRNKVQGSRS